MTVTQVNNAGRRYREHVKTKGDLEKYPEKNSTKREVEATVQITGHTKGTSFVLMHVMS